MEKGKMISIVVTAFFLIVISIFSISFINKGSIDFRDGKASAEEKIDQAVSEGAKSGDSAVTNHVENNVKGEETEIYNSITNNLENGDNNKIDNSITNNIEVNIDVNVTNEVENNVKGQEQSTEGNNGGGTDDGNNDNGEKEQEGNTSNGNEIVWGVDSASLTTSEMLSCVKENFGNPQVWGRYLGEKDGVSAGITPEEVELLHDNDIKILVIWNHFTDATGYENGIKQGEQAIQKADELGIPEGVAIFADIEPNYPVDSDFIRGWYEAMDKSNYTPGIYGIFNPERDLYQAYEKAVADNPDILENTYLWTAAPNPGITSEDNAPEYQPEAPDAALIAGWQYGIDAESCNIDTNLFSADINDVLW